MENQLVNNIIRINGVEYSVDNINQFHAIAEWEKEIKDFLIQFFSPTIQEISFQTSGTTGIPKEIKFSKKQLIQSASHSCEFFQLNKETNGLLCLPCKYVAGRMMLVRAFVSGMNLIVVEPSLNPLMNLENTRINFTAMTPAQVYQSINLANNVFAKINTIIIGGGEIHPDLEKKLIDYKNQLYATFGMTETLTHVAVRKIGTSYYQSIHDSIQFQTNQEGDLWISIPYISREIIKTKDQINLLDKYSFEWLGRKDHVINTGGVKIYAEQIEKKIFNSKILTQKFYVTSKKDQIMGEVPVLVIQSDKMNIISTDKINSILSPFEKIKEVIFEKEINTTPTSKIIRKKY